MTETTVSTTSAIVRKYKSKEPHLFWNGPIEVIATDDVRIQRLFLQFDETLHLVALETGIGVAAAGEVGS
jgi:hypothetical protein